MPATDQSAETKKRRASLKPRDAAVLRVSMLAKELQRVSPELLAVLVYATDGVNSPNVRHASDHERKMCQLLLGEAVSRALARTAAEVQS